MATSVLSPSFYNTQFSGCNSESTDGGGVENCPTHSLQGLLSSLDKGGSHKSSLLCYENGTFECEQLRGRMRVDNLHQRQRHQLPSSVLQICKLRVHFLVGCGRKSDHGGDYIHPALLTHHSGLISSINPRPRVTEGTNL